MPCGASVNVAAHENIVGLKRMQLPAHWKKPATLTVLVVLITLAMFWSVAASMVAIWWRSETFAHCFLILPISLYLIWRQRGHLAALMPTTQPAGLALLAGIGFVWLLARFTDVMVVQHLALVAMLPVIVLTLLGWKVMRCIAFPLGFLFFSVPMGEALISPMMDFTAGFTVKMLQLTGIPVYVEGTFFEIPSGSWSVVEGCSGVRYLIASITLGCLYAYMTYRSQLRRLLFVAAAVIVPIIANGLRAYMIVMIAHLSDMRLAMGVDHFIYGWVFFGLVMLLLFWIGSFWREDEPEEQNVPDLDRAPVPAAHGSRLNMVAAMAMAMIVAWPSFAYVREAQPLSIHDLKLATPKPANGWRLAEKPVTEWQPRYLGADAELVQTYVSDTGRVSLYLPYYSYQRQDAELVNSQNVMVVQKHPVWRQVSDSTSEVIIKGQSHQVRKARMRSIHGQNLLVLYWDWIGGRFSTNPYLAKALEAKQTLLGQRRDAAAIILFAEYDDSTDQQEALIQSFVDDMLPAIETSLLTTGAD